MPSAHCFICLTNIPIDTDKREFLVFPCGHGWCMRCNDRLFQEMRPKCPNCRTSIQKREGHPIFIDFVDTEDAYAASVADGLRKITPDTPLVSIKKAALKLDKVARSTKIGDAEMSTLLKAVEDFRDRIIPLYATTESQKQKIESTSRELQKVNRDKEHLATKLKKMEHLQIDVTRLTSSLRDSEREKLEAIQLAEILTNELGKAHEASTQWQKHSTDLDQENKHLKGSIDRFNANDRRLNEKNRKLKEKIASLTLRVEAAERQTLSDAALGYDGDFSSHEQSKMHSSFNTPISSRSPNSSINNENKISMDLDFQGMPPPKFSSDWQLSKSTNGGVLKKRHMNTNRQPSQPLPIELDKKGRPTKAVQLGPKSIIHIGR